MSSISDPPLQVPYICVTIKTQTSVDIYWSPPPCHMNGSKIMGYKVCFTLSFNNGDSDPNTTMCYATYDGTMLQNCNEPSISPYNCSIMNLSSESYIFRVAAVDDKRQLGPFYYSSAINTNSSLGTIIIILL